MKEPVGFLDYTYSHIDLKIKFGIKYDHIFIKFGHLFWRSKNDICILTPALISSIGNISIFIITSLILYYGAEGWRYLLGIAFPFLIWGAKIDAYKCYDFVRQIRRENDQFRKEQIEQWKNNNLKIENDIICNYMKNTSEAYKWRKDNLRI